MQKHLKNIPSIDKVLSNPDIAALFEKFSGEQVTNIARQKINALRESILSGETPQDIGQVIEDIKHTAHTQWKSWPNKVINGTGIILHTNLGRSPISDEALLAAKEASLNYTDLELNLGSGKRGSRQEHISNLLCDLTGAEAGLVVNNNAAATLLSLTALTSGKEVIVSRAEAVEIGGGFRIPDVLSQSGAKLVEVGTTNRTYGKDYSEATSENTAAILSIHASNFKVVGFTHQTTITELVEIGKDKNVPIIHDVGSGSLLNTGAFGLDPEPRPQDSIRAGADLCLFSGDKLLGGPQAGIIVGKKKYIQVLAKHPLARAFRIDKMNLAALSATLVHYVKGEELKKIPIWEMISAREEDLHSRATSVLAQIDTSGISAEITGTRSAVGGGSLPGSSQPSIGLRIMTKTPDKFAQLLRECEFPTIGRIDSDTNILDLRTILKNQDESLALSINESVRRLKSQTTK